MSVGTQILALLGLTAVAASAALLCARPLIAVLDGALKKWRRMGLVPRVVAVMMAAVATVEAQKGGMGEVNRAERVDAQLGLLSSTENSTFITPVAADSTGFLLPDSFSDVTNLCFWGVEPGLHSVALGIAWPEWMTFVNDRIDIYGNYELKTNGWSHLAQVDVSQVLTNLVVEFNYEDFPTNAMRKSAFFRLAPQDDSDDDGISDRAEEWVLGTNPVLPDTDNDGLPDGDELALKTDPRAKDCDSDGIEDGNEGGYLRVSDGFLWYDTSSLSPWYNTGYWYEDIGMGISSWWCTVASWPIYSTHVLNGLTLNYLTAYETGYIAFSTPEDSNYWIFPPGPRALNNDIWNSGSIMVAAYWNNSYLYKGNTNSYIKAGIVVDGTYVVEFHDVKTAPYSTMGMTYQVSIPSGTGNVIRVSYLSSDYWLDGEGAVVGIQNKRIVTTNGYYNLTWNFQERGPILPRTTIEYHLGYGTSPLNDDTDGDGFDDLFELTVSLSSPLSDDGDDDGLSDVVEYSLGTNPNSADSDGDLLPDKWEVDSGLNPLSAIGEDGRTGDSDGDGLSNYREYSFGTSPKNSDSDGDEIDDSTEVGLKTDPLSKDSDNDGIDDGVELSIGTSPLKGDSDGDGMNDGWEVENRLNPLESAGDDGASGDKDNDGLCNYDESSFGCDPNNADSDGDNVSDFQEICNGSNPLDGTDGGIPSDDFPNRGVGFNIDGDYAAWSMTISGIGPLDYQSDYVTMQSPGVGNERLKILKKGNTYRLTMKWLNSEGHTNPNWYCWQAKINGLPTTASYQSYTSTRLSGNEFVYGPGWMAENSDGLLTSHVHTHDGAGGNVAEGLEALLHVYKCGIFVCDPDDEAWPEIDESRVLLDDENLRIRIKISPAIPNLNLCQLIMGSNVVVSTSGSCIEGIKIPIASADFCVYDTYSEIKITKSRSQLIALGLLPSQDEDGVDELASYDVGKLDGNEGSDLTDCFAFEQMSKAYRGRASNEPTLTLNSNPPNSKLSESFFKAAGAETLAVSYGGVRSRKRQIMNQADYFYYSGHGHHQSGMVDDFEPSVVSDYWKKDLNCVIFAGCSVLDINDYNNNFILDPEDHIASPGKLWETTGPNVLLGYNYYAPQDATGIPEIIVQEWINFRQTMGDVDAWMNANDNRNGRNACAIVSNDRYVYFEKIVKGFYLRKEVNKKEW